MGQKYLLSKTKTYVLHLKHLRYTLMKDFVTSEIKYFLFIYCGIRIKGLGNTAIHGEYLCDLGARTSFEQSTESIKLKLRNEIALKCKTLVHQKQVKWQDIDYKNVFATYIISKAFAYKMHIKYLLKDFFKDTTKRLYYIWNILLYMK